MIKEDLIRELVHKSWHRGCKETDILLGHFARNMLSKMSESFLETYKNLILEADWDIYAWLVGEADIPKKYNDVLIKIKKFHGVG